MPINAAVARKVWARYAFARDNGHMRFIEKADKCERFFAGDQWASADKSTLQQQRRPALTINKIISTLSNVMGEQIYNRSEISFRPRNGSPEDIAECLAKVFKQISDNNQLDWKRSDMFADGVITSRGFIDARIDFTDQMQGEVIYTVINPKNVVIDPDGEDYDPDTWNDVITTKWMTADDIAILYSEEDAEILRNRYESAMPFGYDSIDRTRNRFGNNTAVYYSGQYDESSVTRNIRVLERQYRTLDNQKHFVEVATGDMRPIPLDFDQNRINWFVEKFGFKVTKKMVHRIKWTVVADNVVLHDEWSPYKHLTIVPYFPYFRHGNTIGLVENLLDPQELLNKVSSQELHVVNTTANSGWITKAGKVTNLSPEELEQRGAETGIVIEVADDVDKDIKKITPNSTPQGLDRISFKSEEHIKTISGVSDSMQGFDREDVAAKAIQAKRQAGSTNMAKPLDALVRSDFILARNTIDLIQEFYTEERVLNITKDTLTGEGEEVVINQVNASGQVINDLTMGEYSVVISSVPQRETLEDSQFDQAMAMKEKGVAIDDETIIENSRLRDKKKIMERINAGKQSPEAQRLAAAQVNQAEADVNKTNAEVAQKTADAGLKHAKADATLKEANEPPEQGDGGAAAMAKVQSDHQLGTEELGLKKQVAYAELSMKREKNNVDAALKQEDQAQKREDARVAAAQAAANPQPAPKA